MRWQAWQPLTVVASKSGPKPRAAVAGTRCAENDEQARRLARRQSAQRIDAPHDIGAAPEEDGCILGLERLKPPVRSAPAERTARIRFKLEGLGGDASFREAAPEAFEGRLRYVDGVESVMAAAGDVNKMILVANLGKDPEVGERKTAPNFIGLE